MRGMGGGGLRGLSQWVQLCTWSSKKLWRFNSIFYICIHGKGSPLHLNETCTWWLTLGTVCGEDGPSFNFQFGRHLGKNIFPFPLSLADQKAICTNRQARCMVYCIWKILSYKFLCFMILVWIHNWNILVPELVDPVFVKTSPKRSFSVIQNERFGLVFVKTGSIISGMGVVHYYTEELSFFLIAVAQRRVPRPHEGARAGIDPGTYLLPELVLLNLYGAQESMPRHQFRQPM